MIPSDDGTGSILERSFPPMALMARSVLLVKLKLPWSKSGFSLAAALFARPLPLHLSIQWQLLFCRRPRRGLIDLIVRRYRSTISYYYDSPSFISPQTTII